MFILDKFSRTLIGALQDEVMDEVGRRDILFM